MGFQIRWIGQGGYIFALGEKILCVDPYLSNSVKELDGFERQVAVPIKPEDLMADMILATHDHLDHLDGQTIQYTDHENILYCGPDSCLEHYKTLRIHEKKLVPLNRNESVKLGDAVLHGVYAKHTADSIGVVIIYDGVSVYLVGDSVYDEKLIEARVYKPDILICCINGRLGNMGYTEAALLARKIGVKTAVPSHYGMFTENTEDPANFKKALGPYAGAYHELKYNQSVDIHDLIKA